MRYLDAGLGPERVTVSSDGGGCLPVFDGEGRVASMDVGEPVGHGGRRCAELLGAGPAARAGAAGVHRQSGAAAAGCSGRGGSRPGADADLVVLDGDGGGART